MSPMETLARRAAGKRVGCNHNVHPDDRCRAPKEGASKAPQLEECGCLRGVEELLALDELGL
ncbi:hypothetical protein [Streptomyces kebangsaanensis]|uniref:hypothetical protein n=1 Tax=Streptomyces kebangsaanensis TaxID=864058 RepID=UPI00093A8BB6|nr:hypothetical protein [Streptomyces kebangsaanensis]